MKTVVSESHFDLTQLVSFTIEYCCRNMTQHNELIDNNNDPENIWVLLCFSLYKVG